jgi:xanthine permease XanP
MRKPPGLVYGVDDVPPLPVTLLSGLQHVALIAVNLVYPVIIFRAAGASPETVTALLSVGLCVLGITTFLQANDRGPIGSGYMCPTTFTATYLAPTVLAAKLGGLPLVFGMTAFAGLVEGLLAPALHRLRALVPVELAGLVILLIGFTAGLVAVRAMLGDPAHPPDSEEWLVFTACLALTVGLNIWASGLSRMLCALIGMTCGYAVAAVFGVLTAADFAPVSRAAWVALPDLQAPSWSFDLGLAVTFAIAALAAAMKALGTLTVCQRTNDADWVRPDTARNFRGVLADSAGSIVSGAMSGVGINTSTPSVGVASATGVTSRVVAYAVGGIFLVLALTPKIAALLAVMPRAVMAAALLFCACFIVVNGLQVVTSRLLDSRRTIVIGMGLLAGAALEAVPAIALGATDATRSVLGSSLVFGTVVAFVLNLFFRLGVRQTVNLPIDPAAYDPAHVEAFLRRQGGVWGARADIVNRATFGACQLVEAVIEHGHVDGAMELEASFDEYRLDIRIHYRGEALPFPQVRPTLAQIQEQDGSRQLAGFLLRRNADRIRSDQQGARAVVWFHFDH